MVLQHCRQIGLVPYVVLADVKLFSDGYGIFPVTQRVTEVRIPEFYDTITSVVRNSLTRIILIIMAIFKRLSLKALSANISADATGADRL